MSPGILTGIDISPDGKQIVTSHISNTPNFSEGPFVIIWKVTTNTFHQTVSPKIGYAKAAFSHDGRLLALGGEKIDIFDLPAMNLVRTINLPEMSMSDAVSNPDRFKQYPNYEEYEKKRLTEVKEMTFSPDSKSLAVGTNFGTINIIKIN